MSKGITQRQQIGLVGALLIGVGVVWIVVAGPLTSPSVLGGGPALILAVLLGVGCLLIYAAWMLPGGLGPFALYRQE